MSEQGTILVVDDCHESLKLLTDILSAEGYQVRPADSGELALASVAASPPELILLDINMPGMNGSELATQLVLHHPEMKVLFTSGYTDNPIVLHRIVDEGTAFIGKPYSLATMAIKVREVIDKA